MLKTSYDKESDVLYITEGKRRQSIGRIMNDGVVVRRDPKTKEIIGFTIVNFMEHFTGAKAQRIPLKAWFSPVHTARLVRTR